MDALREMQTLPELCSHYALPLPTEKSANDTRYNLLSYLENQVLMEEMELAIESKKLLWLSFFFF